MNKSNLSSYTLLNLSPSELSYRWKKISDSFPKLRIRDVAQRMGVSEAQLLATQVGKNVIRLEGDWKKFVSDLLKLGPVMSLTRNDQCVLEHVGKFEHVDFQGHVAIVVGSIETRIFLKFWCIAFAVRNKEKKMTSLQVFDHSGMAITKIYLKDEENFISAYNQLVDRYRSKNQDKDQSIHLYPKKIYNNSCDLNSFKESWSKLKDTHDFYFLLNKYNLERRHALELIGREYAYQLPLGSLVTILKNASSKKIPIMIFVGNRGNIQIHQGYIEHVINLHGWLNILDTTCNMHLLNDGLESVWVVKKPTVDGIVTGIEVYDKEKTLVVQFFGLRKPGTPEREDWCSMVSELPMK